MRQSQAVRSEAPLLDWLIHPPAPAPNSLARQTQHRQTARIPACPRNHPGFLCCATAPLTRPEHPARPPLPAARHCPPPTNAVVCSTSPRPPGPVNMSDHSSTMQQRRDEILAKKAKLAELKRQREMRQKEFTASRQSMSDASDVRPVQRPDLLHC